MIATEPKCARWRMARSRHPLFRCRGCRDYAILRIRRESQLPQLRQARLCAPRLCSSGLASPRSKRSGVLPPPKLISAICINTVSAFPVTMSWPPVGCIKLRNGASRRDNSCSAFCSTKATACHWIGWKPKSGSIWQPPTRGEKTTRVFRARSQLGRPEIDTKSARRSATARVGLGADR